MISKTVTIINKSGLHARPAAEFIKAASAFKSRIQIAREDRPERAVNAKSMVLLLTLGAEKGCPVQITASGEDETQAVETLASLVQGGFGEVAQ